MATLWAGSNKQTDNAQRVQAFTAGTDATLDLVLAPYDVQGSMAHVKMLAAVGLLTQEEGKTLLVGLQNVLATINAGTFVMPEGAEDIHSAIELLLTAELGNVGKKIHTARSRNDQVLTDLKLFFKAELKALASQVGTLAQTLLTLSNQYAHIPMPGYTHYQVAMPSSFGLWLGAYAEALAEDLWVLEAAYKLADKNPLGSAAGYGSSFPIDRALTTQLLGFGSLHYNSINAQMSRGKTEKAVANALAAVGATLARLAGDVVLFASQNYGFVTMPAALATGSSIMPHKKNPDVFELVRARGNRLQALPATLAFVQTNLHTGYHRDLQVMKENIFPALADMAQCVDMMAWAMPQVAPVEGLLGQDIYKYLGTVEEINSLVVAGVPFRDAYRQVAATVENGTYAPESTPSYTHIGSVGNLGNAGIRAQLDAALAIFL